MRKTLLVLMLTVMLVAGFGAIIIPASNRAMGQQEVDSSADVEAPTPIPTVAPTVSGTGSDLEIEAASDNTASSQLLHRAKLTWPWYVTRASGIVAAVLMTILVLSGIGFISGYTFKFLEPITAWATHRAIGIALGVAVLAHITALLFDHFLPFTLLQVLVPFASQYKPVAIGSMHLGSLFVALGVLAFYLLVTLIITSLIWVDKKPKTWKWLHFLSYFTVVFVFFHALFVGTDTARGWVKIVWISLGIIILLAGILRLYRARTI